MTVFLQLSILEIYQKSLMKLGFSAFPPAKAVGKYHGNLFQVVNVTAYGLSTAAFALGYFVVGFDRFLNGRWSENDF